MREMRISKDLDEFFIHKVKKHIGEEALGILKEKKEQGKCNIFGYGLPLFFKFGFKFHF